MQVDTDILSTDASKMSKILCQDIEDSVTFNNLLYLNECKTEAVLPQFPITVHAPT